MTRDLLDAIQYFTARSAITSSSMRGSAPRTIPAARDFLGELSLKPFGTTNETKFNVALERATTDLLRALPQKARHWGRARKGLNIFLRGCLYTCYLRDAYNLHLAEDYFEMPLDSITGQRLFDESDDELPPWETVRGLDSETSATYQRAARALAEEKGIARVHLDAIWWGRRVAEGGK